MRTWFFQHYEDPAQNTPWIDGEYVWLHGGPYDAAGELHGEFGGRVKEEYIDELAEELNDECSDWAGVSEYEPDYDDYPWTQDNAQKAFEKTMSSSKSLLKVEIPTENEQHFLRLQYASTIMALEAYLSDFFIAVILQKHWYLQKFVESNIDFAEQKFGLNEVFQKHSQIRKLVEDYLRSTMWHNLSKVQVFYGTLGIKFPSITDLYRAVSIRHDIVHRGGNTRDGKEHKITRTQVKNLIAQSESLVSDIETQWKKIEREEALVFFEIDEEGTVT